MKILLDTNIVLDAYLPDRPENPYAFMLVDCIMRENIDAFVSSLTLKDVYYVLCRCNSENSGRSAIKEALLFLGVLAVDEAIIQDAVNSNEPDFEDGIIRSCAEFNDIDFIITRDKQAYRGCRIRSLSAREFLEDVLNIDTISYQY